MCEVNAFGCRLQVVIHPPPLSIRPFPGRSFRPADIGGSVCSIRQGVSGAIPPYAPFPILSSADNLGPMLLLLDWDKVMGQGDGRGTARGACFRFRFCSGCLSLSISREKSCPPVISEIKSDRLCRKVLRMNLPAESVTFHAMGANQIFLKVYVVAALWSLSSISSKRTSCVPVNCSIRKVP